MSSSNSINPGILVLENAVKKCLSDAVDSLGIMYKLFVRAKDPSSVEEKILKKERDGAPYSATGKKMQDLIGARIVTYFYEDEELLRHYFQERFPDYEFEKQETGETIFEPQRRNLVCRLSRISQEAVDTFNELDSVVNHHELMDSTFELQLRTVFSEGWHEIDHALKYKCQEEWNGLFEESRMFCGLLATLETADRSLKKIFDDLAYKHYKEKKWQAMLRTKYRLHFENKDLRKEIIDIFNNDNDVVKKIFKADRKKIFLRIISSGYKLKPTFDNLVYVINYLIENGSKEINRLVPTHIMVDLKNKFSIN